MEKGAIHILRGASSVKKTPRKLNQTEISARSCNLLFKSYISSGSCEAAIHIWRQGEGFAGVRSPRQSRPRLLRGIEWSVKLKPCSGSDLKSFFVRLVVVEHLHHHLNLLDEIPWCWIARWQVQCTRQRYYSALVKQNKNPLQIQGLCSDNQWHLVSIARLYIFVNMHWYSKSKWAVHHCVSGATRPGADTWCRTEAVVRPGETL